ncbi:MAG: hypothetical protein KDI39_11900 [Pseudomonadales bacterium]|nr:hypothetical protein [Pseudomonadales bacterium]
MDILGLRAVHIVIGVMVIVSGLIALLVKKGSIPHKVVGQCFVVSQVIIGLVVLAQAWFTPERISSLGILFVFFILYLVVSAWLTIHRPKANIKSLDMAMPFMALAIATAGVVMGFNALHHPNTAKNLAPTEAYFLFSALAFMAMLLDVRYLNKHGLQGKQRIIRHVWRMGCAWCFAVSAPFSQGGVVLAWISADPVLSMAQMLLVGAAIFAVYQFRTYAFHRN